MVVIFIVVSFILFAAAFLDVYRYVYGRQSYYQYL